MYAGEIYVAVIRITGSVDWGQGSQVGCYDGMAAEERAFDRKARKGFAKDAKKSQNRI